jgi:hypothetical protein
MPYASSPIRASPDSFSRMRLYAGMREAPRSATFPLGGMGAAAAARRV